MRHLGIVQKGFWHLLAPLAAKDSTRRLKQVAVQEARSPESGELDLSEYKGCLLWVEGREDGDWIWLAQVVDQCDAEMSEAVSALLGSCAVDGQWQRSFGA